MTILCGSKKMGTTGAIRAIKRGEEGEQMIYDNIHDIKPHKKNVMGVSPFLCACKLGNINIIKAFLEGPNTSMLGPKDFSEGLWNACSGNHLNLELCSMLLTNKWNNRVADPNFTDRETLNTPLHLCLRRRKAWNIKQIAERSYTIALLVKAGAKFDILNMDQKTPLEMGIVTEFERGCVSLVKAGAPLLQVQTYLK